MGERANPDGLGRLSCLVGLLTLLIAGCGEGNDDAAEAPPPMPPAVTVVAVGSQEVTPAVTFTGRVEAIDTVDLRARVEGFLEKRHFTEGQDVREGDLLFTIEKAQYEAAVAQAEANVARAQATQYNAQLQLDRAEELVRNRNIAVASRDDRRAERDTARAELAATEAALQTAKLNLSYTDIKAPISGRIGTSAYSQGDLVNPASGVLATIVSQDPIYVTFPVSARELLEVRERAAREQTDPTRYQIKVRLPDGRLYDQTGTVDFVDVRVDPSTDTVTLRAEFPNPHRLLVDGSLVGVIVEEAQPKQALVVPQAAVLNDQAGSYVLVVDAESKVEQRRVQLGQIAGPAIAVRSGLKEGEKVVTEGVQKVRPGQTVQAAAAAGA
ncbi:MAG: efflux RND transporter periplasmic adaptor subunit [Geminicoccaceae bacterium]